MVLLLVMKIFHKMIILFWTFNDYVYTKTYNHVFTSSLCYCSLTFHDSCIMLCYMYLYLCLWYIAHILTTFQRINIHFAYIVKNIGSSVLPSSWGDLVKTINDIVVSPHLQGQANDTLPMFDCLVSTCIVRLCHIFTFKDELRTCP